MVSKMLQQPLQQPLQQKIRQKIRQVPRRLLLVLIAGLYVLPLLIILTNSFMSPGEITRHYGAEYDAFDYQLKGQTHYVEYHLIPEMVSLDQYNTLLFKTPTYLNLFLNSLKLTLPIVVMQTIVGAVAAYGFTVWKSRFREALFCAFIIVMVLPFQATLVPNYLIAENLGILNTRAAVVLPIGFSPFAVFIIRQNMKGIPSSIFEAAQLDGANHVQRFIHIALPLSKSGIAALMILTFADCWAMVEQPMILLQDASLEPLSVLLSRTGASNMGLIFAASIFYMLPVVWVFLYGLEHFEQGIQLSALK